jgi:hypothetical protein
MLSTCHVTISSLDIGITFKDTDVTLSDTDVLVTDNNIYKYILFFNAIILLILFHTQYSTYVHLCIIQQSLKSY